MHVMEAMPSWLHLRHTLVTKCARLTATTSVSPTFKPAKTVMSVSFLNMPLQTALRPSLFMRSMLPLRLLTLKMRSFLICWGSDASIRPAKRP